MRCLKADNGRSIGMITNGNVGSSTIGKDEIAKIRFYEAQQGADPFGPTVREDMAFGAKLKFYRKPGFDGVQFHDDDAVPKMNDLSLEEAGLTGNSPSLTSLKSSSAIPYCFS